MPRTYFQKKAYWQRATTGSRKIDTNKNLKKTLVTICIYSIPTILGFLLSKSVFWIRIASAFNWVSGSGLANRTRILIQAGRNWPKKWLNPDPDSAIDLIQIRIRIPQNTLIRIRIQWIRIRTLVEMSMPYLLNQGNKALKKYVIMLTNYVYQKSITQGIVPLIDFSNRTDSN